MRRIQDAVPGRVFSDKVARGRVSCDSADRLTPIASTIHTAAAWLHDKGVSAEAVWLSEIWPSHNP